MAQHDAEAKLIQDGMQTFYAIRDERDKLRAMCSNWERAHQMLQSECESMKQRLIAVEAERGFYQRFSSELVAHVGDIGRLAETVLVKSRQGAYRPNGAAPKRDEPADHLEVPKFLTDHGAANPDQLEQDMRALMSLAPEVRPVRGFDDERG